MPSLVSRAHCYDMTLDDYDLITLKKQGPDALQGWKAESQKSTMTNNTNVTLTLPASDRFLNRDHMQITPTLVLNCLDGQPNAYVNWNTAIGIVEHGEDYVVNTRLGAEPVVAERWAISNDRTSTFIPKPVDFFKKILNQNVAYMVKVWPPPPYDIITTTFNVQGLAEKIQSLKDACHLEF